MNRYINRILLAVAALFATAGTAKAADALTISGSVTNATVKWYKSTAEPTAAPSGAAVTTIAPGEWIILEVTPQTGYWTYDEIVTIQGAGSIGGAEARTRSIIVPVHLKALSGNQADGKGYYYLQIPAEWKNADGYTKVIVGGEAIPKIDLSSATIDATGKIVTATTGNWTATITLDEVKWTYDESAHGPAISAFELTNGTKTFSNTAAQVAISGSETNPGSYNATLSAVTSGCFLNSKAVPFSIEAISVIIGGADDASATAKLVISETEFTYTGLDQKPTVKVVLKSDNSEIASTEYNVSYKKGDDAVTKSVNVGTYTVVVSSKTGGKYTFSGATTASYEIKKAPLTIKANDKSIDYGTEAANDGVTYTGFVNGESATTEGVFSGSLTYTYNSQADGKGEAYAKGSKKGTYYIIPNGLTSTNYDIKYETGILNVGGKTIVIGGDDDASATAKLVIDPTEFTYDGSDHKPTVKVVMKSDNSEIASTEYDVVYKNSKGETVTETKNADTYTLNISSKAGGNYTFSGNPKAEYKIKKVALTVTAKDKAISYGEEGANAGVEYSGFVTGESETTEGVFSGSLTYTYNSQADGKGDTYTTSSPVDTYYIIPGGLTSTNYDITFVAGKLTVSKNTVVIGGDDDASATAKLVLDPTEFTYNGKDQKPAVKIEMKSDKSEIASTEYDVVYKKGDDAVTESVNAGTYTVVISSKASGNYTFSGTMTASYKINPATLTVTAKDKTISYGEEGANDGVTYAGFVNGESETTEGVFSGSLTYTYNSQADGKGEDYTTSSIVGTYYIIPIGLTSTNYDITFVAGKLKVSDKVIVIGGDDDASATAKLVIDPTEFTYNGKDQKPTVKIMMKSDNSEIASTEYDVVYKKGDDVVTETKDAGTYTVVISNKDGSDYAFSGATTASYQIKSVALTITANDKTVNHGEEGANAGVTYSGFVNGESETTEGVFSGSLTYTYNSKADGKGDTYTTSSTVGTYYIIPSGLTSTNYDITFVAGKLTVSDKVIVIGGDDDASATAKLVVDPTEFTYNGKDQKPTVKVVMKSDNSEIASTEYTVVYKKGSDAVTETKDVGSYTLEITNKEGAVYAFSGSTTASYKINRAALTVTAKDKTISYGEEAANDGVTYSGFVNGESETTEGVFSGSLTYTYNSKADGSGDAYTTSSLVGTYYIIPSGLTSTNYDITFVAGKLTVSDKVIVIGGDDDASATAKLVVDPTEFTYNGKDQKPTVKVVLKSDNSEIASTEYDVVYKKGSDAVTETKDAGTYTVVISNKEGADYAFSGATTASYQIKSVALTVTANDKTISYGDAAANAGVTFSGFVNNETSAVLGGTLEYAYNSKADGSGTAYTTSSPVGTYYIIPSGLTSTNYDITFSAGKLTVSKNPIVIGGDDDPTATAKLVVDPTEFTYNGLDQKPTVKVVLKSDGSEIVSTEYDVKFRKGENAVTDTKDAGTYTVVISNKEGSDYAFSGSTTASYEIKRAALTVTAKDKTISHGDAAANDGVEYSGFVNNETSAVLSGTLSYTYNSKADGSGDAYTTSSPVGTYYIIPSGLTSTNYDITFAAGKLTVSKNPIVIGGDDDPTATAKLVVDPTEFTYNGEDQKPTVKVVMKSDNSEIASTEYTVVYKKGDDAVSESVNAGTYTVVISNKEGSDYAFSGATTADYVIKPADATLEPPTAKTGLVENGVNQELVDAGSATGGTLEYSLDGTNWSTDIPTGRKADTYTVYYRVIGDQNHNDIDAASLSVTIAEQENPEPVDRKHSGIRVVRNDTQEVIDNDVFLILIGGKLRIEQIDICETNDLEKLKEVGVSIYIPEELTTPSGAKAKTSGMAQDIIVNKNNLPVTDIYLPETEQMLNVGKHAFRLDPTESTTAFIHVPLHLLDNYALTMGLQAEYEAGKVMTTVKPSTVFWTFSSAVDIVMPDGLAANICKSKGDKWVNFEIITTPKVDVDGTQRTLIKANNGILMRCSTLPIGSYELRAWPSDERPSGLSPIPTDNAYSYPGNELVPVIEPTHFEPTQYYILFNNLFSELEPDDKTSVTACKAVLPKSSNLQARTLTLIDGEGTGIEALSLTPSLEEAGSWYDLQGRKLSGKPKTKGVYIHNGKQEIIK